MKNKKALILVICLIISIIFLGGAYVYLDNNEKKYNENYIADNKLNEEIISKINAAAYRPTTTTTYNWKNRKFIAVKMPYKQTDKLITGVSLLSTKFSVMKLGNSYQSVDCPLTEKCEVELSASIKDTSLSDKVAWIKNDVLTDLRGTKVTVVGEDGKFNNYQPCILGNNCPGDPYYIANNVIVSQPNDSDETTTKTYKEAKLISPDTVKETTKPSNSNVFTSGYYYAKGTQRSGSTIKCGDKIYISVGLYMIPKCYDPSKKTCYKPTVLYYNVSSINGVAVTNTTILPTNVVKSESETGCIQNIKRYAKGNTSIYGSADKSVVIKTFLSCGDEITFTKDIDKACNDTVCEISFNNSTAYIDKDSFTSTKPTCNTTTDGNIESTTCTTGDVKTGITGTEIVKICGKDDNSDKRNSILTCADGYNREYVMTKDTCGDTNAENCYREYRYTCVFGKKPGISASSGMIGANDLGQINLTGYDYGSVGLKGYYISAGIVPSENSEWKELDSNNKAIETQSAGTYFVWIMNNKNVMSNSTMVKIYDGDLSTTLKEVGIVDENNGEILDVKKLDDGSVAYDNHIVDSKYVLLTNQLLANSTNSFDSLTTGYELETTSNKIAIYATLTSEDARYVTGYEPRTINLEYGKNIAVIKIVNNQGKERSYTFIINRKDDRSNTNTLKSIKLSKGKIDFDPYVMNYEVEIGNNVKKISINAELSEGVSAFIEGYGPRTIDITEEKQSAIIKVMSESGIVRSYVITFTKKSYTEDNNNSAYLSSLTVPGTQLSFDRETYDYTVTVPYETENLPIYAFAESESADVNISNASGLQVGNNLIEIEVKNGKNTKVYSLHVIRKEYGLDISNSTKLSMLSIKDYDINFDPNVLDYTVKIKREKTLMIAATPESNRADIYMYGNNDLTGFSTVRVKVIAENGATEIYSIDIKKDAYNKKLEIIVASVGCIIVIGTIVMIVTKKKKKSNKEYLEG